MGLRDAYSRYGHLREAYLRYGCLCYGYLRHAFLRNASPRYGSFRDGHLQNRLVAIPLWLDALLIWTILFKILIIEFCYRYTSIFSPTSPVHVRIIYVLESATYGVVFTSCLCENPNERVRAFDTNNE